MEVARNGRPDDRCNPRMTMDSLWKASLRLMITMSYSDCQNDLDIKRCGNIREEKHKHL